MKRSKFSLSNYKLLTMDMGSLIPINWHEVLPGDTVQQSTSALIRVKPLLAPVMHPVRVRIHHWFVPNRLIWEEWEDFITGGDDGKNESITPFMSYGQTGVPEGGLHDYFGVPPNSNSSLTFSALPSRAYNLIYNEHYRDQDLVDEVGIQLTSGPDNNTSQVIQNVAWEKDYFTTGRPWEQKGNQVTIPIGSDAPIIGNGVPQFNTTSESDIVFRGQGSLDPSYDKAVSAENLQWQDPSLLADLSQTTGITVNDLRLALSIQRYQEARAKFGSRYVEYLRHLGIKSSDGRQSLPEYLGGGRQVISFSEIVQSAPDPLAEGTEVGTLRGHGIAAMRTNRYRRFFEEHGICMTLMSVIPKTVYTSQLKKGFSRQIKEDYYQKELQFIGEQEIPNKEINSSTANPDDVFAYQSRYDEYRSQPSSVAGEFHTTQDHWHYAREFEGEIALNQSFIESVPTKRVHSDTTGHVLNVMANHSIQARRMIPKYPTAKTF